MRITEEYQGRHFSPIIDEITNCNILSPALNFFLENGSFLRKVIKQVTRSCTVDFLLE